MLLFETPLAILHPLCELLDNWRYDDDQGEYQPVYEEFGSILLLVLAFVHRYNLSTADLGIRSSDSFIVRLLHFGHFSKPMEETNSTDSHHMGKWILGLFDTTNGAALHDELLSSCPPQNFYLLTGSLFSQIVLALSDERVSEDMLKSCIECKSNDRGLRKFANGPRSRGAVPSPVARHCDNVSIEPPEGYC
jgi:mediator of RNA polymerase II transcription subunit 5